MINERTHLISAEEVLKVTAEKDRVRYIQLQSFRPELLTEYERAFMNIYETKFPNGK